MSGRYGVEVRAVWRRRRRLQVDQGLAVDALTLFEVVRHRRLFSSKWEPVKPVSDAASRLGSAIRLAKR